MSLCHDLHSRILCRIQLIDKISMVSETHHRAYHRLADHWPQTVPQMNHVQLPILIARKTMDTKKHHVETHNKKEEK